jgi:Lsr2
MRRMQLFVGCDMTFATRSELVPADETVILSLDGTAVELDLTAEWAHDLREKVRPYIRAGHAPGAGPELPEQQQQPKPGRTRREIPGTRKFYASMREYAASQQIEVPLAGRKAGTRTKAKRTYSYPDGLLPAYIAHLEGLAERGDGAAIAQLAIARALGLVVEDAVPADPAARTGVRAPCARCHHPKALHGGGGLGIPCKATGCRSGPEGTPCPEYMALAEEHAGR